MNRMLGALAALAFLVLAVPANAAPPGQYSSNELITEGQHFFGNVTQGLASIVERAVSKYGLPNGYILGQEGAGAFIGGLRYGEGVLSTKNVGAHNVFWQGPSIGADFGGSGDRVMMLVYNLPGPGVDAIYQRYFGVSGSAYVVAGFGMTVLSRKDDSGPIYVVPIVSGVGLHVGANLGYLKFTGKPTWNPF